MTWEILSPHSCGLIGVGRSWAMTSTLFGNCPPATGECAVTAGARAVVDVCTAQLAGTIIVNRFSGSLTTTFGAADDGATIGADDGTATPARVAENINKMAIDISVARRTLA